MITSNTKKQKKKSKSKILHLITQGDYKMVIDLNQVIRDIAGGFDTAKRLELEMREELLKEQQEQQHQLDCDEGELDELQF